MNRNEFFVKVIRFLLFGFLAAIIAITGKRVITGNECASCPGNGICSGETDCSQFLSEKR